MPGDQIFMKKLTVIICGLGLVVFLGNSQKAFSQNLTDTHALEATARLDEVLTININNLAVADHKTWNYWPSDTSLGTNRRVWTWPVNLSCVGMASDGYQSVLIAPDKLLTCGHYMGEQGKSVQFHDTNGIPWTGYVSKVVNVVGDMCISFLRSPAPPSILIPSIFPPDATNYLPNHSFLRLPAFWLHKNGTDGVSGGTIQYDPVLQFGEANAFGAIGTWMRVRHNGFGPFGNGTSATGGDSGGPAFMMFSNTPVLLFAATTSGDAAGMFVSGSRNFTALAAGGYTNGMDILDLRNFKKFP
jgi:hypothetical protein